TYVAKFNAVGTPFTFNCKTISDDVQHADTRQAIMSLTSVYFIFSSQHQRTLSAKQHGGPGRKMPQQANLNGSSDMECGKLFCWPDIQDERAIRARLYQLSRRQLSNLRSFPHECPQHELRELSLLSITSSPQSVVPPFAAHSRFRE